MIKRKKYTIRYKRRRQGKTNYKKRLKLLLAKKPRLVIRKSLNSIIIQVIEYNKKGDITKVCAHSKELKKLGWKLKNKNLPAAYLTGLILGIKAKKAGIKEVILDIGLNTPVKGCKIYSALKGVLDAGIEIPHSKEVLPPEERIKGTHIVNYAKEHNEKFSEYLKNNIDTNKIPEHFEEIKSKVLKNG